MRMSGERRLTCTSTKFDLVLWLRMISCTDLHFGKFCDFEIHKIHSHNGKVGNNLMFAESCR